VVEYKKCLEVKMNTVKIDSKGVKMVAHRGCSGLERENTFPAFVAAGSRSYFGVESDVHMTADGNFVIIHDSSTKRVSLDAVDIVVENSNFEEIDKICLPDLDGSYRRDIKIPLLSEYICICKKYEKICVLELKDAFTEEMIKALIAEISALKYLECMIFISFNLNNCKILRKLLPEAKIQWLIRGESASAEETFRELKENKLDVDICHKDLTRELLSRFKTAGMEVNCWTCDDPSRAAELIEMGVDYITSNILE
jgi:glycerophosphoryl diester phosphodiesterase